MQDGIILSVARSSSEAVSADLRGNCAKDWIFTNSTAQGTACARDLDYIWVEDTISWTTAETV
jgi:hypothetical protein